MIQEMSARKALIFRPLSKIKDNKMSPSSIELWNLMYLETCVTAEAIWDQDWMFCPVCLAPITEEGVLHRPRKAIEQ
jgi:hypothetical protein